ncbi:hydroxymethylbilane synthase [Anopheles sinensis]|uniref:Hydroxymethylbilane synthase n=1 Tax=Anopheles sinensis TaxID=74873 RepID=A0A084VCJ4_ANOSI|nr:hydroxymethylbilane synthase [Anopheles sinensis]
MELCGSFRVAASPSLNRKEVTYGLLRRTDTVCLTGIPVDKIGQERNTRNVEDGSTIVARVRFPSSVFRLWAEENLQRKWKLGNGSSPYAINVFAKKTILGGRRMEWFYDARQ